MKKQKSGNLKGMEYTLSELQIKENDYDYIKELKTKLRWSILNDLDNWQRIIFLGDDYISPQYGSYYFKLENRVLYSGNYRYIGWNCCAKIKNHNICLGYNDFCKPIVNKINQKIEAESINELNRIVCGNV